MLTACRGQVRAGFGGAYSLDFGSVLAFADAIGADVELVAEILPEAGMAIIAGLQGEQGQD